MRRAATYVGGFLALLVAILAMVWSAMRPGVTPGNEVFAAAWEAVAQPADRIGRWFATAGDVEPDWRDAAYDVHGGDAASGRALMVDYGCGACHGIPGIAGADGSVGPALAGLRQRAYIGGVLPNEPGGLVRWIVDPTVHSPNTAMPDLGVTEAEARDMAAYLYTLRGRP